MQCFPVPALWPPRRSRVGLVGYGFIAGGHLAGIAKIDGVEVVAVVDVCLERRVAAQRELPGVHVVGDLADLDVDELDALLICTPPGSHLDAIAFGLEAGLAVICEKPLVPTVRELEALEAVCAAAPGLLYPPSESATLAAFPNGVLTGAAIDSRRAAGSSRTTARTVSISLRRSWGAARIESGAISVVLRTARSATPRTTRSSTCRTTTVRSSRSSSIGTRRCAKRPTCCMASGGTLG